jgi:hypothetical protein
MKRPASLVTAIFLLLLACIQLFRVILGVNVVAGGIVIPIWPSAVAFIFLICLALWLLTERKK